jgi:predicted ATPase
MSAFPFSIPAIHNLTTLTFHPDVTFFVGENGSGKSTLIEGIAMALGFGAAGGTRNVQLASVRTAPVLEIGQKLQEAERLLLLESGKLLQRRNLHG